MTLEVRAIDGVFGGQPVESTVRPSLVSQNLPATRKPIPAIAMSELFSTRR